LKQRTFAIRKAAAANARHLASLLARQAAVLLTRNAKAQRRKQSNFSVTLMPPTGGIFHKSIFFGEKI